MDLFAQLELMPVTLSRVFATLPAKLWGIRSGPFAFVEHCWHLADLEREGFGSRIDRLLAEDDPFLPDFNGEKIAAERQYLVLPVDEALAAFAASRARNLAALRAMVPEQWQRSGLQEGVGRISLGDLPRRMLDHDHAHRNEIADLLADLSPGHASIAELRNDGPKTSRAA
jgi:DinB family protein